ncbi:efflux RND transporter permease subunit [Laceyella tengchongensis]
MRIVDGLTQFSLRNAAMVFLLVVLITAGGVYTATQLKMESMPDIDIPVIAAVTGYPGASPQEVDEKVTKPIEQALQELEGVKKVTSMSSDSVSMVAVEYSFNTDLNQAKQEMQNAIEQTRLPKETTPTSFNRFGFNSKPFMILSVTSKTQSITELEQWVKQTMTPALKRIKEVGKAEIQGQSSKAVYVRLKQDQLKKYNLSVQQVQQALQGNNVTIPVGDVHAEDVIRPVQIDQKITSVEQLKNLRIPLYPNPQENLQKSMKQIDQGFQGLGQSVGQLGQGLGQVGQGLGLLQAQMQLMQAAQQLQAKLLADQLALNAAQLWLKQHPEDEKAKATVATLKPKVDAETKALKKMNDKLKQLQNRMPKPERPAGKLQPGKGQATPAQTAAPSQPQSLKTIKLSQIANVTESIEDAPLITRVNGKPSVNIELLKNPDGNIVDAANKVKEKTASLMKQHPGLEISVLLDQSAMVKLSIHTIIREGLLGALFAMLVILLFLRNLRTVVISIVSIPLSIMATLIFLDQADLTLNVMTLGGLAVAIGRIVDDSLVVIENIHRHRLRSNEETVSLIQTATKEVASAITSSTFTTVVVFIPLGFIDGVVGKLFTPFALTIVFSLLCSLVVSITIVPLMAKYLLKGEKRSRRRRKKSQVVLFYQASLDWAFQHKAVILISAAALLAGSLCLIPVVGTSFIPADQNRTLQVKLTLPPGTSLSATNQKAKEIESQLKSHPEVQVVSASIGNLNSPMAGDTNHISLLVSLRPDTDTSVMVERIRQRLQRHKGNAELQVLELKSLGPSTNQITSVVKGERISDIQAVAAELTQRMKQMKGLTNVSNNLSEQKKLLNVDIDQQKASSEGLTASQVAMSVRALLKADKVNEITQGNQSLEIRLGLEKPQINLVQKLKDLQLLSPSGRMVKLGSIATVKEIDCPLKIQKENGQQYATISGDAVTQDTGALSAELRNIISEIKLPPGVEVTIGGDAQQMSDSFQQIGIAIAGATLLVYLVMLATFKEATTPFTILFSLPFAVIGGLVGLWIAGLPISVAALIGALMLIGIVVTNAIVLLDRVHQQMADGLELEDALLEAAGTRLRPIMMTACATVFALIPAGLGIGEGNAITQGLSVVVIGGLISSTLLTLYIVPIMYLLLSKIGRRNPAKQNPSLHSSLPSTQPMNTTS